MLLLFGGKICFKFLCLTSFLERSIIIIGFKGCDLFSLGELLEALKSIVYEDVVKEALLVGATVVLVS